MYKTCEEYVLACLDITKNEYNKLSTQFKEYQTNIQKQLDLDKEIIEQKTEDIRYLVELINALKLAFSFDRVSNTRNDLTATSSVRNNPDWSGSYEDLIGFLNNNIDRLGIKIMKGGAK